MKNLEAVQYLKSRMEKAIVKESTFLGEVTLEVNKQNLKDVLYCLKQQPDPGYEVLMDLTGVDYLVPFPQTKVVYWLHNPMNFERLRIVLFVAREEKIPSVVDLWEGANWYERELFDLFGIQFEGNPDMQRILMPDDWIGHPLRRDYALGEEVVQFKHNVRPKTPSQIINCSKSTRNISQLGTHVESNEKS